MMNAAEREKALVQMRAASAMFYANATRIGVHPFIEFCGLMNEYIKAAQSAHDKGIDFSECNVHSGQGLPLQPFEVDYINEKLMCVFVGHSVMDGTRVDASHTERAR